MGGFLPYILLVMLPSLAITGWAAWRVRSTYARWSKVDSGIDLSAFDFARQLLDRHLVASVNDADPPRLPLAAGRIGHAEVSSWHRLPGTYGSLLRELG